MMQGPTAAGRIKEMLISEGASGLNGRLVTIEVFKLGEHIHPDFEMTILSQLVTEYCTGGHKSVIQKKNNNNNSEMGN